LTHEYAQKAQLNTRIVRLGELVGEGVEFNNKTPLGRLIFEAINGDDLKIYGDGLEEEYYVNYLDATYGILKAQFTPNTKGKTFSLSNEEAITVLSLAYKIQELETKSGEIKFLDERKGISPLKLYKPAPNLSTIGWRPKVSFERSLSQSIEEAKSAAFGIVQEPKKKKIPKTSFSQKLKNFFFVAEDIERDTSSDENYGALSRLIAERKQQELSRKGSILLANKEIETKKKSRVARPKFKVFKNKLNKFFDSVKPDMSFISKLTLGQFLTYAIFLLIGGAFYFVVIAPLLSLTKDVYFGYRNLITAQESYASSDVLQASQKAFQAGVNFESAERVFSRFKVGFDLTKNESKYQVLSTVLRSGKLFSFGLADALDSATPLYGYFESFDDEVFFRPNSESLLTAQSGSDYTQLISEIGLNQDSLEDSINRMDASSNLLTSTGIDFLPKLLREEIILLTDDASNLVDTFERVEVLSTHLPELIGAKESKTYLIIFKDNSRLSPSGGYMNSYALVSFDKGSIRKLEVGEVRDLNLSFSNLSSKTLEQINLTSFADVEATDVSLEHFESIGNFQFLNSEIKNIFELALDSTIDGVISVDLDTLESLLELHGNVTVDQVNFDSTNLLSNLSLILQDNPTEDRRISVLNEVFALTLQKVLTSTGGDFLEQNMIFNKNLENKGMILNIKDASFEQIIKANNWNGEYATKDDYIRIFVNTKRTEFEQNRKPALNVNITTTISNNFQSLNEVTIEPKNIQEVDYVVLCIPAGSTNLDFQNANPLIYNQNFDSDNECISINFGTIDSFTIKYNSPIFDNKIPNGYNYDYTIYNNPGLDLIYDYELNFDSTLIPQEYTKGGLLQNGKLIYAGVLDGDLNLTVQFRK
jgi:hypothetical protein